MIGVIGSNGFIGRTLVDRLVTAGWPLRAYTRQVPAFSQDGVSYVLHSMTDGFDPTLFADIQTLVLLASASRPNSQGNSPLRELEQNVTPHLALFEHLKTTDVQHLIYLSSGGAIYGDRSTAYPITEDEPCTPSDAYGFGKLCIENALPMIWQGPRRRFTIIRPSNPIGKHQLGSVGAHGLVSTVLHHLRSGMPIMVQGDGRAVRDYFSATDLADLVLMAKQSSVERAVVNASSGTGLSILDVIERCASYLGVQADVRFNPGIRPAVRFNVLCNRRAAQLFGWQPKLSLTDIMAELNTALDQRDQAKGTVR